MPVALFLITAAGAVQGQAPTRPPERLAGIIAIVGDSVITDLDLRESFELWRAENQNQPIPDVGTPEYDDLVDLLLDDRVTTLLLVQAALRDTTIRVPDDEIDRLVQQQIDTVESSFRGRVPFEAALRRAGLTFDAYRDNLRAQIRRNRLAGAYLNAERRKRKPPPVSDAEIRDLFSQQGDQIPSIPPGIVFEQIMIPVSASDSARERARLKTDSILAAIRGGEEFEAMARRFSEDGSSSFGGDLGWFRPGNMVPEFERAAFAMKTGEITGPVETQFGFHIIKLERIRGPERSARHILIRPVLTDADTERARALAESVAARLRAGASFDSLRRAHGDRDEISRVGPAPRDSLPDGFREALGGASVGHIPAPFEIGRDRQAPKFVVARVTELTPARTATVEDYRTLIKERIAARKLNEEIIAELRRRTYVEVRKPGSEPR